MCFVTLGTAKRNCTIALYHEVLAALHLILKVREYMKGNPADTLLKLRELFNQRHDVAVPTHSGELARL